MRLQAYIPKAAISHPTKRQLLKLLLALPVLFYLGIAAFWQANDLYQITGDEPGYVITTDSLMRDGDLLIANNLLDNSSVHEVILRTRGVELAESPYASPAYVLPSGYPTHSIGMSFILLVPYYIGGVTGAKIFLALLAGFFPLLFYRIAYRIIKSEFWSVVVALTLALGLPYLAASNQIYPDLVGGLIILVVAERTVGILTDKHEQRFTYLDSLGSGVLVSLLPWLHIRLGAPAVVLLLGYVYAILTTKSDQAHRPRWRYGTIPIVIFALSTALLFYYNYVTAGNILGVLGSGGDVSFEIEKVAMIFLGLHWDQSQGMFMQQPLLLLGLVGVVPLIKANRRVALLLGVLYLSVLLVVSMHPIYYYGGGSFIGRFEWAAVSLWIFPLSYAIQLLLERNKGVLVLLLCAFCLVLQGLFAITWLPQDYLLNNGTHASPNWGTGEFHDALLVPEISIRSPSFKDFTEFNGYLKHAPNYVVVSMGLLLVASGWLWQRGSARLAGIMWALFLPVGIGALMLFPPVLEPVSASANDFPGEVGTVVGKSKVATEAQDEAGFLIRGGYPPHAGARYTLPAGEYEFTFEYESSNTSDKRPTGRWTIESRSERETFASGTLPPSNENGGRFKGSFSLVDALPPNTPLAFKIKYLGRGYLRIDRVTIRPLDIGLY